MKQLLREAACDLLALLGCIAFAFGFWLAWRPLGFIMGGLMLAVLAFLAGYRRPSRGADGSEG